MISVNSDVGFEPPGDKPWTHRPCRGRGRFLRSSGACARAYGFLRSVGAPGSRGLSPPGLLFRPGGAGAPPAPPPLYIGAPHGVVFLAVLGGRGSRTKG